MPHRSCHNRLRFGIDLLEHGNHGLTPHGNGPAREHHSRVGKLRECVLQIGPQL